MFISNNDVSHLCELFGPLTKTINDLYAHSTITRAYWVRIQDNTLASSKQAAIQKVNRFSYSP